MTEKAPPRTVAEALQRLLAELDDDTKRELAALPQNELDQWTHFGIGLWIRNEFGLPDGSNQALIEDCTRWKYQETGGYFVHLDMASYIIVEELWRRLTAQTSKPL